MVGRFAIRHFCSGFLYGKMAAWLIGRLKVYFLLGGSLNMLEVCDNERVVLRKKCVFKMCGETYSKG